MPAESTYVYVAYDDQDAPLYVGQSVDPARRLANHPWWRRVARLEIVHTATNVDEARRFEADLIRELRPPLNVQHNGPVRWPQSLLRMRP